MDFLTPQFGVAALEIIVINILLSGDNAVVIALACRNLPKLQRNLAIAWGVAGAIVLRIILTAFAGRLLLQPWLQLAGAALLLWIGIMLIADEEGEAKEVVASERLLSAVRTVIVADLVMSVDNVIGVAGAAKGSIPLLIFGLVVSIPLVVVGSQIIMRMIGRFPWLVQAGGALLGYIAGEIATTDAVVRTWIDVSAPWLHWVAPAIGGVAVAAGGTLLVRRRRSEEASGP